MILRANYINSPIVRIVELSKGLIVQKYLVRFKSYALTYLLSHPAFICVQEQGGRNKLKLGPNFQKNINYDFVSASYFSTQD